MATVEVNFPDELVERIEERAAGEGYTVNELIVRACERYAQELGTKQAMLAAARRP